jgi:DNA polymerase
MQTAAAPFLSETILTDLPHIIVDFETRSAAPLVGPKSVGAWRYAEDETTSIICLGYKEHHGQTKLWTPYLPFPEEIKTWVEEGRTFEAHNAQFERAIWTHVLMTGKYGGEPVPMPGKWIDTLAACAYRGLPLGLDQVGSVLGLNIQKDKRGKYLIQQLCKPRKPRKKEREDFIKAGIAEEDWPLLWREDWELIEEMYEYCMRDVDTEEELGDALGLLPPQEQRIWVLDQIINQRGIHIDTESVENAIMMAESVTDDRVATMKELTDNEIQTGGEIAKITAWLRKQGCFLTDLRAETVEEEIKALEDSIKTGTPEKEVRGPLGVLRARQALSKASTKKLYKFRNCVNSDNRARGLLQYHGASTGRWAGRLIQPHNFPRGSLEDYFNEQDWDDSRKMDELHNIISQGDPEMVSLLVDEPMDAISSSLRGMFSADKGKVLMVADFSAIEAVVLAWLAGEQWKVDAFYGIQNGEGYKGSADIYCATASTVFGYPVLDKKSHPKERQVGKTCELAFGYMGGVNAWYNFDNSGKYSETEIEGFRDQWRGEHPKTCAFWYGSEEAALLAIENEGKETNFRNLIGYQVVNDSAGKWLACTLPDGKMLWYFNPCVQKRRMPWGKDKWSIQYEGKDSKRGGSWGKVWSYGGMLVENIVQAVSRQLMVEAMIRVEVYGYPVILTVHDEIVSEVDKGFGSLAEFEELMSRNPPWAEGCPISVDGWEGQRYRK